MGDSLPRAGDIVVHRQVHSPAVYVLSRLDGPLQFFCRTSEDAVAHAARCAHREQIDVWYTTDEQVFERVVRHRSDR